MSLQEKLKAFMERLVEERKKRMSDRKKQRKEDRRNAYYRQKEEEAQRIHEEQLKQGKPFVFAWNSSRQRWSLPPKPPIYYQIIHYCN